MPYIGNAPYQGVIDSGNIVDGSIQTVDIANSAITSSKLAANSVTTTAIASDVTALISQGGGPKITNIQVTNSSYSVLDDTAVDTAGGYIKITGTNFTAGCQVLINNVAATSTTFVSSTEVRAQVPATAAGTYIVYLVNSDGGVAIRVNGLTFSAVPSWTTGSTLPNGANGTAISIQLAATSATSYALQSGSTLPAGLTLSSSGLLSGTVSGLTSDTTYNFTVVATDAELQDSPRAFTITITGGDPYYKYTTLLLSGNGTNLANNNTFLDSSTANSGTGWPITRNPATGPNAPTQGTFSPFSQTGWGNYFSGSSQYLSLADNAAFTLGTNDFTIECWVYNGTTGVRQFLAGQVNSAGSDSTASFYMRKTNTNKFVSSIIQSTTAYLYEATSTNDLPLNSWVHIAFVRDGNTLRQYINGVQDGTASVTGVTVNDSSTQLAIGRAGELASDYWYGYISNFRFVKGRCVYPSGTSFTPPTAPLGATSGGTNPPTGTQTSLLTCQSNRFVDNSTNNFTLTITGSPSIQAFSPFKPSSSWFAAANGGSGYFDGTGDYLTTPSSSAFAFGLGDFTVEYWVYITALNQQHSLFDARSTNANGWVFFIYSSNQVGFYDGSTALYSTDTVSANSWNHIAYARSGSSLKAFLNGKEVLSVSNSRNNSSNVPGTVGASYDNVGYTLGYISNIRIVKGTAVYTGAFTPPIAPLTNAGATSASAYSSTTNVNTTFPSTNCSLLLNFTNAGIYDATSKNDLETVGNAQVSTAISAKWGSGSIKFNGSTDYLIYPATQFFDFGAGDFTVEGWFYFVTIALSGLSNPRLIATSGGFEFVAESGTNLIRIDNNGATVVTSSNNALSTGSWLHIAGVRSGTSLKIYVNGTQVASTTYSTAITNNSPVYIGKYFSGSSGYFDGYLQDLRITKGYARYVTGTGANAGKMVFNGTNDLALPTAAFLTL